jgi:hypothetical protein
MSLQDVVPWMMRAGQGDAELDALVDYDHDYIDDLMRKWNDIYSVTSHLSGGVF